MAGLGRRSHYRKHLTDSVLNDLPEPSINQRIAKVTGTRGSNQFELLIGPPTFSEERSTVRGKATQTHTPHLNDQKEKSFDTTSKLAILPTKFRKLVWLKRNDYVICSCANNQNQDVDNVDDGGIKYMIEHILYRDQVRHLKYNGFWPNHEIFFDEKVDSDGMKEIRHFNDKQFSYRMNNTHDVKDKSNNDDGIVYDTIIDDDICNVNHIATLKIDDSESDSE